MNAYTLSFEEFVELHQDTQPTASVASFIAMVFIAVAVGMFGAVLTYAVDPGSKMLPFFVGFPWFCFWQPSGICASAQEDEEREAFKSFDQFTINITQANELLLLTKKNGSCGPCRANRRSCGPAC